MAATQIILLERVENLGNMGDVVTVKPGYARNYLLPQKKALRASKENIAFFEAQKKALQAENAKKKEQAAVQSGKLDGQRVPLLRQASEGGQLYGSVTSRDIAEAISEATKIKVERSMILLNQSIKTLGLFSVAVALHPEVKVQVIINIARSLEEAEAQAKSGKAAVTDSGKAAAPEVDEEAGLEAVLEEGAAKARKAKKAEQAEEEAA